MQRYLIILATVLVAGGWLAGPAAATDRSLEITDLYLYADEHADFTEMTYFDWPEYESLTAVVELATDGYSYEEKVSIYLVVLDEDEEPVVKEKLHRYLPAGEFEIALPDIMRLDEVFEEQEYLLQVEVDLPGVKPRYEELYFTVIGPDLPDAEIIDLLVYNSASRDRDDDFKPGSEFTAEILFEVDDNESSVNPHLVLYAVMDEDMYETDPQLSYQPFEKHWDVVDVGNKEGVFEVRATGLLPYFFADPYDMTHDWRVYAIVVFGNSSVADRYVAAELWDDNLGEHRADDELLNRLIELERSSRWQVRKLRSSTPDTDKYWNR
jgi:hypothetical protein